MPLPRSLLPGGANEYAWSDVMATAGANTPGPIVSLGKVAVSAVTLLGDFSIFTLQTLGWINLDNTKSLRMKCRNISMQNNKIMQQRTTKLIFFDIK